MSLRTTFRIFTRARGPEATEELSDTQPSRFKCAITSWNRGRRTTIRSGSDVATAWNKEQAELLRSIALAGGIYDADECQGPTLDALIETGFATVQIAGHVGTRSRVEPWKTPQFPLNATMLAATAFVATFPARQPVPCSINILPTPFASGTLLRKGVTTVACREIESAKCLVLGTFPMLAHCLRVLPH